VEYNATPPAGPVENQAKAAIAARDEFAQTRLPQRAREAAPEPRVFEKRASPLVTSAAFGADPWLGNGEGGRVIEPPPPLPEHRPYDLAGEGVTPVSHVQAASPPGASEPKEKLAMNGAISFLADLFQAGKPAPTALQTARAPDHASGQATALSNASAAPASARPRKSAVVRWEPAACDRGQRFWER
jgi:hypothetical protein